MYFMFDFRFFFLFSFSMSNFNVSDSYFLFGLLGFVRRFQFVMKSFTVYAHREVLVCL